MNSHPLWSRSALLVLAMTGALSAQQDGGKAEDDAPVSRAEYDNLVESFERLLAEFEAAQRLRAAESVATDAIAALDSRVDRVEAGVDPAGSSGFLISGFGHAGYVDVEGDNSTFGAQVNPVFLWELSDKVLFETELEVDAEAGTAGLEFANVSYLINDRAAVSVGQFLTPLSHFSRDLHPSWINKLPDMPLHAQHHGGLLPITSMGAQLNGAAPVGEQGAKIDYAFWVSNGPMLELEGHHASTLDFENVSDSNGGKALGARIGFSPTESLSFGAAAMVARVDESGADTRAVDALLTVVDFTYVRPVECLGGRIDVRGEFAHSRVDDPSTPFLDELGLPLPAFDNERQGGYVQVAFRPTLADSDMWRDLEFITRFDFLDGPRAAGALDRDRTTLGVDWWLTPSSVFKVAYRVERVDGGPDRDAVLLQWASGF